MLQEYTIEELAWEYYNRSEREEYAKVQIEAENDKIEIEKEKQQLDWAEQMMKEEEQKSQTKVTTPNPVESDEDWIRRTIEEEKKIHGETFGEDIVEEF